MTITGTGFLTGATVSLGGTAATNVTVVSATSITAKTAAHAAGAVNVVVTNTDAQAGTLTNGYTYTNPAPTVTSITPTSGTTAGGTSVTITGTGFLTGATVSLGGTAATNVTVVTARHYRQNGSTRRGSSECRSDEHRRSGWHVDQRLHLYQSSADGHLDHADFRYDRRRDGSDHHGHRFPDRGNGESGWDSRDGSDRGERYLDHGHHSGARGRAVNVVVTNTDAQAGTLTNGYTYSSSSGGGPIAFVQVKSATPQTASASVPVTFTAAQTAGNMNVVVVGWNDTTSTVSSVTDSRGNTYTLAIGPTTGTGLRQSIYYAKNIAAGTNTVTVRIYASGSVPRCTGAGIQRSGSGESAG